jgi:ligand-binding sensor domain-containing protein
MKLLLTTFYIFIIQLGLLAQYPAYFSYNVENGAPSNEVYGIIQDKEGYIWIGCDAGVYRFNGISYEHFTSPNLTTRAATGLIQVPNGRIYGYNFNRQLFYIENNNLHVIKEWDKPINGIAADKNGAIWISSSEGAFLMSEKNLTITEIQSDLHVTKGNRIFTSHAISDNTGSIYYHNGNNIIKWEDGKEKCYPIGNQYFDIPLFLSKNSNNPWIFDQVGEKTFNFDSNSWKEYVNSSLKKALKGRKINSVFETSDGNLWIATYSGMIRFHVPSRTVEVLYNQFSFSNGLKDQEGNLWFSTLNNGIIRIPEMGIRIWNYPNTSNDPNQFSHITHYNGQIYFAGTTGSIGTLALQQGILKKHSHEPSSDIGMFYYDNIDNCIYFNKLNNIYRFRNSQSECVNENARPLKSMLHIKEGYFILSSQGLYLTKQLNELLSLFNMIDENWYRDICVSTSSDNVYLASNNGLIVIKNRNGKFQIDRKFLVGKQIVSVSFDEKTKTVFCLSFEGAIYQLDSQGQLTKIKQLGKEIRATQLRIHQGEIFLATNSGIIMIEFASGKQIVLNKYKGLSSNNIRAISFDDNYCWAAGDKGIQQIPLYLFRLNKSKGKILARGIRLNGGKITYQKGMKLSFNDELSLEFDGLVYRSNGNFQYAYRFKEHSQKWITVPGTIGKIDFPSLPTGKLTIEIKLIDHTGANSLNNIEYHFYVTPPFWQRWWFYLLISVVTIGLAYFIFKKRVTILREKQTKELQQLKLENELRLTQQNALKAQMNPHFLFNVLNSIKGYIYEDDKKSASNYLNDFSSLVRKILELSSLPEVSLEQELDTLQLYIKLEAMLLQNDFTFTINIDENTAYANIKIPALIIQPYVENAFKHGLRHKHGPKHLEISIQYDENNRILKIIVSDNGVGRKASTQLNRENRAEHQSFATSAMEKRIELLNFEKTDLIGVEILDKFDNNGESIGTSVIIRIHV